MGAKYAGWRQQALLGLGILCALTVVGQEPTPSDSSADGGIRGAKKPVVSAKELYGKKYAIVIGINYEGRDEPIHLPKLTNAERDAETVATVLEELYGFKVIKKLGKEANAKAINLELAELAKLAPADAVLFYYSGHGVRLPEAQIYPYDVELQDGRSFYNSVNLQDVAKTLEKKCPADHKLIVLDSCHSGEIFSTARPRSIIPDSAGSDVRNDPCLYAIAACRGSQVATDGPRGDNSPFTAAFVRALRRLPTRESKPAISASRVFLSMQADFSSSVRHGQSPDCRNLVDGDGEFLFFPETTDRAKKLFATFAEKPEDFMLLQAMVPGEYGKWWFDETPWFIPSLRDVILEGRVADRGARQSAAISRKSLEELAKKADAALKGQNDKLTSMRRRHFQSLQGAANDPRDLQRKATEIVADLEKAYFFHSRNEFDAYSQAAEKGGEDAPSTTAPKSASTIAGSAGKDDPPQLEATDVHLLAVLRHYLSQHKSNKSPDKEPASKDSPTVENSISASEGEKLAWKAISIEDVYAKAIELYEGKDSSKVLQALCYCDRGNYFITRSDWQNAQADFRKSLEGFLRDDDFAKEQPASAAPNDGTAVVAKSTEAPAAFLSYVLSKESDTWKKQNRWGEADNCLQRALAIARNLEQTHSLTAAMHRQVAWCLMEQWRIREAEQQFLASNMILVDLASQTSRGVAADLRPAASPSSTGSIPNPAAVPSIVGPSGGEAADSRPKLPGPRLNTLALIKGEEDKQSFEALLNYDFDAAIDYLHNHHGLAMTRRFQGDVEGASAKYRLITQRLAEMADCLVRRRTSDIGSDSADVETRLVERLVNTQERLGDCNLFGNPDKRNPAEAADDYRRALSHCSRLPNFRRPDLEAKLRFKQALALAMPSPIQDVAHALYLAELAQKTMQGRKSDEMLDNLSKICLAVIQLDDPKGDTPGTVDYPQRLDNLREAIRQVSDSHGGLIMHRDQLELLMLAAKIAVDHAVLSKATNDQQFQAAADAEVLLGLCRQVLPRRSVEFDVGESTAGESCEYLRPFYDAVMRLKLNQTPINIKELFEIQWEATTGTVYFKPAEANPVLALYVLDRRCWMFLDMPHTGSKPVCVEAECSWKDLCRAAEANAVRLPLPLDIQKEVSLLGTQNGIAVRSGRSQKGDCKLYCRWIDPVRGLDSAMIVESAKTPTLVQASASEPSAATTASVAPSSRVSVNKPTISLNSFPFELPAGLTSSSLEPAVNVTAKIGGE